MEASLWFLSISLGISLLYSIYKLFPFSQNARLPPGPAKLPIVGNLFDLDQDRPHISLANLAKSYGPIMSLKFGLTTTIVISSPEAAQDLLQTKDVFFSARPIADAFYAYNHKNRSILWLPSTSPLWKQLRATCSMYLLSPRCLESTQQIREKKIHDIMQHLRRHANRPVEIGQVVFAGMLNILSNMLFSEDVVDLDSESRQEFKELIASTVHEVLKPNISDFFPFLRRLDLQGRRRCVAGYLKRFYDFFDGVIDRRLKCGNDGKGRNNDFLDSLLKLHVESKLDRQTMKIILTEIFAAGTDTTAITVVWAMTELLHEPVVLAKAQSEVRQTFQSEVLKEVDVSKFPYLQAVVKEAMRMHPAGPLSIPHKAMQAGVELGGFVIPKGARVIVNIWAIGRDPKFWDEPNVFRPERFLEKEIDFRGNDFEFIPFGFG
ncbi:hypothetical protein LUZ60_002811 [Juncus effusus]|nr:hypothetical protein LUZ60_002811 [Juncus effusus]